MKIGALVLAVSVCGVLANAAHAEPRTAASRSVARLSTMGSLGSGFAAQPGLRAGAIGGPVIRGAMVNGTLGPRRR